MNLDTLFPLDNTARKALLKYGDTTLTALLVVVAMGTLWIAVKGNAPAKAGLLVYLLWP